MKIINTLFSALVHAYARYTEADDAQGFIDYFHKEEEKIKISSLFYYLTNNKTTVYFLPKPAHLSIYDAKDGLHKIRNKIAYVSHGVWADGFESDKWVVLDENKPKEDKITEKNPAKKEYFILDKKFVITKEEFKALGLVDYDKSDGKNSDKINDSDAFKVFSIVTSPKSPQRGPEGAAIYYQADVQIATQPTHTGTGAKDDFEIGWYYIYEADGIAETDLQIATNIMAYTGIGGEISNTGRTPEKKPEVTTIADLPKATKHCNVSLLCPADSAEFAKVEYYQTTLRGGRRISKTENAKIVRMIRECALVNANHIQGQMPILGEDNNGKDMYRLGKALFIPCNIRQQFSEKKNKAVSI